MGRKRVHADPSQPLPPGLYKHGRHFRARLPGASWTDFGTDYVAAMHGFAAWSRSRGDADTIAWLLDIFTTTVCAGYVQAKRMKPRTMRDYQRDSAVLKKGLGKIPIKSLRPVHVADYRDARAPVTSHVRNEMACLSAAMSWAVEKHKASDNPCLQVRRPRRVKRLRLITDDEYLAVHSKAEPSIRLAMLLGIRTLALPADVLKLGPRHVVRLQNGKRVLRFARNKTSQVVEISLTGELEQLVDAHLADNVIRPTFVYTREGKPYTVDGIGAMFRRYCEKASVKDFGLRDLRAKGATDEYRAGRDLRSLQHLLGHKSQQTTEIYIKSLVPETVRPNERPIIAEVKT